MLNMHRLINFGVNVWKVDWAEKRFYPEMFNCGVELEIEGCCGVLPCDQGGKLAPATSQMLVKY